MAGFKTHITTSTTLGIIYGTAGCLFYNAPVSSCMLAGGLCSVSGMLPDLDSDSGVPVREMTAFGAAVVPMLLIDRFRHFGWSQEMMVFVGGVIYVLIRFGVVELFKKYTVHRGMWHSIPAAAVVGLLAYLVCDTEHETMRGFLTGGVVLGFLSHLVLDEFWSLEVRSGKLRVKRSFGTALKLWGRDRWGNISVYAKLIVLIFIVMGDPMLMKNFGSYGDELLRLAEDTAPDLFSFPEAEENSELEQGSDNPWPALDNSPGGEFPLWPGRSDQRPQASEEAAPFAPRPGGQLVPSPVPTFRR